MGKEADPFPRPAGESQALAGTLQGPVCVLPPTVRLPWRDFSALVCSMFILCTFNVPSLSAHSQEFCIGVEWGAAKDTGSCLLGACGPGQSWQPPQEERTFRGRLRSLHSCLLPPPPLTPASKEKGAGAEEGGGGMTEASAESAPCCLGLWRAGQATTLDSQAPYPGQPPH